MPPNTWYWGGIVPVDYSGSGFWFANFCGDHAIVYDGTANGKRIEADKVAWWCNALDLPPDDPCRGSSVEVAGMGASPANALPTSPILSKEKDKR